MLVITPSHNRMSTAEGLRVYASNNCPDCDPVSYIFEGRANSTNEWVLVHQGDLPWKNDISFPRNRVAGLDISSTYMSADSSFVFTEVSFYEFDYQVCGTPALQLDYRGSSSSTQSGLPCQAWSTQSPHGHSYLEYYYPDAGLGGDNNNYCRNPNNRPGGAWCYTTDASVRWEYCAVPDCENDPASLSEYLEYKITLTATRDPSSPTLQIGELEVPGLLAEKPAMPILDYAGVYVSSITRNTCVCNAEGINQAEARSTPCGCITFTTEENCESDSLCEWNPHSTHISLMGGHSTGATMNQNALDRSTNKFSMSRESLDTIPGAKLKFYVCPLLLSIYTHPHLPSYRPAVLTITRKNVCAHRSTYLHLQ